MKTFFGLLIIGLNTAGAHYLLGGVEWWNTAIVLTFLFVITETNNFFAKFSNRMIKDCLCLVHEWQEAQIKINLKLKEEIENKADIKKPVKKTKKK